MLYKAAELKGYKLDSRSGELGRVSEFYFDDLHWIIRYLVADTGDWLPGRQVLLSPYALGTVTRENKHIAVDLTRKQIEDSPPLESDKPVSQQFEVAYYGYFGWPMYWGGPHAWGPYPYLAPDRTHRAKTDPGEKTWDPHLRSTHHVTGYYIQAADGEIGHVSDFIIEDSTWAIRYLVIDTRNWWPGKKVLLSPTWIERVSWSESKVFVSLSRDTIRQAPEYTDDSPLTREHEAGLYQHYDRPGYWVEEPTSTKQSRQTET